MQIKFSRFATMYFMYLMVNVYVDNFKLLDLVLKRKASRLTRFYFFKCLEK